MAMRAAAFVCQNYFAGAENAAWAEESDGLPALPNEPFKKGLSARILAMQCVQLSNAVAAIASLICPNYMRPIDRTLSPYAVCKG